MQQLDGRNESADASTALQARHMSFTQYLATRHLSVDLFDADTRLQIGTASISLQGLLRQGREHAECILKVPLSNPLDPLVQPQPAQSQHSSKLNHQQEACSSSRGVLQVRHPMHAASCAGQPLMENGAENKVAGHVRRFD